MTTFLDTYSYILNSEVPSKSVFRLLNPDLLVISTPFKRHSIIPLGTRTIVIRLASPFDRPSKLKRLLIVPGSLLDLATKYYLSQFAGPDWETTVAYLLLPNSNHGDWSFLREWKSFCKTASFIGPSEMNQKLDWLKLEFALSRDPHGNLSLPRDLDQQIQILPFTTHSTLEIAIYHVPSRSLIVANLLFNLPSSEQFSKIGKPFIASFLFRNLKPGGWLHGRFTEMSSCKANSVKKNQLAQDAAEVDKWDFERIIPIHGNVIELDSKIKWSTAYGL